MAVAGSNPDGFIRCCKALHLVVHQSISCVDSVLKNWLVVKQKNLPPCSRPRPRPPSNLQECSDKGKPMPLASCPNCVAWGKAVEDVCYPPSAKQNMSWENSNPMCLSRSHIQVAKAFIPRLQNKQYNKLEHFDLASMLMIMRGFKEFHKEDQMTFDTIKKVSDVWNKLCHMQLEDNQHLDSQQVDDIFRDLSDLVSCLQALHPRWFTAHHAQDIRRQLTEIKTSPVTAQMRDEVLKSFNRSMEEVVQHTKQAEQRQTRQEDKDLAKTPESNGLPMTERELDSKLDQVTVSLKQLSTQHREQLVPEAVSSSLRGFNNESTTQEIAVSGNQYNVSGDQTSIGRDQMNIANLTINYGTTDTGPTDTSQQTAATDDFSLTDCQEELRDFYLTEMGKVQLLPWMPDETVEMESIFVDLELIKKKTSTLSAQITKLESNEDLITLKTSQGLRFNRVLIQGEMGSGKSTLADNIAYKWALQDRQTPLSKFSLVFMIRMHKIHNSNDKLEDLIFQQILPEDSKVSKDGLKSYITDHANDILLLVDGLDEDSSGTLKNKSSEITQILHNRRLRKCCVILTTRPQRVDDLREHQKHYTEVRLKGFSDKNIRMYIQMFFPSKDQSDQLIIKLEQESLVMALAAIPVLLLMICLLWQDHGSFPDTKTKLYRQTIQYLWKRYQGKDGQEPSSNSSDEESAGGEFESELEDLLNILGETVLKNTSTEKQKIVFKKEDFGSEAFTLGCHVGLISRERLRSHLQRKSSVTFLHVSFRDYCAGVYLAYLLNSNQSIFFDHLKRLYQFGQEGIRILKNVLDFACGTNPKVPHAFMKHYTNSVCEYTNSVCEFTDITVNIGHIFESQLPCEECLKLVPLYSRVSNASLSIINPDYIHSILYQLRLWESSPIQGRFFFSTLKILSTTYGFTPWLNTLFKYTTNLERVDIQFFYNSKTSTPNLDESYKALSTLQKLKSLILRKSSCFRCDFDLTNLLQILSQSKQNQFQELQVVGLPFDCKAMVIFLASKNTLSSLTLIGMLFGQLITINEILRFLPNLKKIDKLRLTGFQISSSAIKHLRPIIAQLQSLHLDYILGVRHMRELFLFLPKAQKLKHLHLSGNKFTAFLVDSLVRCLKQIPYLEELYLENTCLDDDCACILAKELKEMATLNILYLDQNPGIGKKGHNALADLPESIKVHYDGEIFKENKIPIWI